MPSWSLNLGTKWRHLLLLDNHPGFWGCRGWKCLFSFNFLGAWLCHLFLNGFRVSLLQRTRFDGSWGILVFQNYFCLTDISPGSSPSASTRRRSRHRLVVLAEVASSTSQSFRRTWGPTWGSSRRPSSCPDECSVPLRARPWSPPRPWSWPCCRNWMERSKGLSKACFPPNHDHICSRFKLREHYFFTGWHHPKLTCAVNVQSISVSLTWFDLAYTKYKRKAGF